MRPLLHLVRAVLRAIHHVPRPPIAAVAHPGNKTFIVLRFSGPQLDLVFAIKGIIEGEALHLILDALLEEHRDEHLIPLVHVTYCHPDGTISEEAIRLDVV